MTNLVTSASETDPVVTVTGGAIRGRLLPERQGSVFRGIPFAQPPVGDLRWREPMPVIAWSGIREADMPGAPAAQAPAGWNNKEAALSKEDCLYLDVWTPVLAPSPARLPVMVWIHGGGNTGGAGGSDPLYDGKALISHGVILVVVEYRLGIFGFFAHPELTRESPHRASGNYGLLDQLAALQWVRANIARFGGDAENVTLFGQSAGSFDLVALLGSPLTRGLVHRAIAESGTPAGQPTQALADAEKEGLNVSAALKAPAENALSYLRSLSPEDLLKAHSGAGDFVADGWLFPSTPGEIAASGKSLPVPMIIGTCGIEFPAQGSIEELKKTIHDRFKDLAPRALALYGLDGSAQRPAEDPVYGSLAEQLGGDFFRGPSVIQGEWHSAAGNLVWEYEFNRAIPPHQKVTHSGELAYVFGNLWNSGSQGGEFRDADRKLSGIIQNYWTNFAKTGNPNGPGVPHWPNFDGKTRKYLVFTRDAAVTVSENQRGSFIDLYRELLSKPSSR